MSINKNQAIIICIVGAIAMIAFANYTEQTKTSLNKPAITAEASFEDLRSKKQKELDELKKLDEINKLKKESKETEIKNLEIQSKIDELETGLKVTGLENNEPSPQNPVKAIVQTVANIIKQDDPTELPKEATVEQIQAYINKYFATSPVSAQMIFEASHKTKIPAGFILAVGHNESHMGTKGRAVQTQNPFNVGNVTAGDRLPTDCSLFSNCLSSWQEGLDSFTSLISRCYFNEGENINLQTWVDRDFKAVRCNIAGKRYMTDVGARGKYLERIKNLQELQINY